MLQFRPFFLHGIKVLQKSLGLKNSIFRLMGGQYTQWNKNSNVEDSCIKKQVDIYGVSKL